MNKKLIWIFLAAATLVMIYVMKVSGEDLKTSTTKEGILNLEFAYNGTIREEPWEGRFRRVQ